MASLPGEPPDGSPNGDPDRLAAALMARGIAARVEAHGRLAVLTLREPARLPEPDVRAVILAAGRDAGFSSVAVELTPTREQQP